MTILANVFDTRKSSPRIIGRSKGSGRQSIYGLLPRRQRSDCSGRADAASRVAKALQLYEAARADLRQADSVLLSVNIRPTKIPELPFVKAVISTATQVALECDGER